VTIFAFGQTGSGKTHTMLGPRIGQLRDGDGASTSAAAAGGDEDGGGAAAAGDEEEGLLTRCLRYAYGAIARRAPGEETVVLASCLEVYNENVTDLLAADKAKHLQARTRRCCCPPTPAACRAARCAGRSRTASGSRHGTRPPPAASLGSSRRSSLPSPPSGALTIGTLPRHTRTQVRHQYPDSFYVEDLTVLPCASARAAGCALSRAMAWRHTRAHKLNEHSSRSHCIVTLEFHVVERDAALDAAVGAAGAPGSATRRVGKLRLVDLAGSERLKETGNTARAAVQETGAINRSLFCLGQARALRACGDGGAAARCQPRRAARMRASF
jgi:hypothetical protein